MKKRNILLILGFCLLLGLGHFYLYRNSVRIIELPTGNLQWSTVRPSNASLCVPAAYTASDKTGICGQYLISGVSHGIRVKGIQCVSVRDESFIFDRKWHSSLGFQQHALVNNAQVNRFHDTRYFCRRALCKKNGRTFIIESYYPMTMSAFARECGKHATEAVNLDMGKYAFGYYSWHGIKLPLAPWAIFWRLRQTNWLYID